MNMERKELFKNELICCMPKLVEEILLYLPEQQVYGISFLTTDDFYGMYVGFNTKEFMEEQIKKDSANEYQRWMPTEWPFSDETLPTDFNKELYKNLVEIIDHDKETDFMRPSDEKWAFALFLIEVINEAVRAVPKSVFTEHGYEQDSIVFSVTMSDGDYMDEMFFDSLKKMNKDGLVKELLKTLEI